MRSLLLVSRKPEMKCLVLTGGGRGIGYGLALEFLRRGCRVVISGRDDGALVASVSSLAAIAGADRVSGVQCDVRRVEQVQALWDAARDRMQQVDIWINNAGVGHRPTPFWDMDAGTVRDVVETNLTGAMFGSAVALRGMLAQGFGALYNMEGLGSDGRRVIRGLATYSATKAALRYLDRALAREVRASPVIVGAIQPGMVVTRLLTGQYEGKPEEWARARRVFNLLAERIEDVTPWLAERILSNTRNGARIAWPSRRRFLVRVRARPFYSRDLFAGMEPPSLRG